MGRGRSEGLVGGGAGGAASGEPAAGEGEVGAEGEGVVEVVGAEDDAALEGLGARDEGGPGGGIDGRAGGEQEDAIGTRGAGDGVEEGDGGGIDRDLHLFLHLAGGGVLPALVGLDEPADEGELAAAGLEATAHDQEAEAIADDDGDQGDGDGQRIGPHDGAALGLDALARVGVGRRERGAAGVAEAIDRRGHRPEDITGAPDDSEARCDAAGRALHARVLEHRTV